ncbi:Interleukin-1 receptor-associated kinase 1-binding protein 1 [Gryllus bimaculatus]|nr:Interleukin-1 receptor-associated kinase 1-binding protein 1 [Gryllus bimaculatus]
MEACGDDGGNTLSPTKVPNTYSNIHVAHVEGSAEILIEPDVVEFLFRVESIKDKAEDAKQSVTKRIDYLLQIIRNANIKGDVTVTTNRLLQRTGEQFRLIGEVLVQCDAEQKYEEIINIIVEKLESGVTISEPHFFHSSKSIQEGRQHALKLAVSSARSKAQEIALSSGQQAGQALIVEEKESRITRVKPLPPNLWESISKKRFSQAHEIQSRIVAVYELTPGNKCKE